MAPSLVLREVHCMHVSAMMHHLQIQPHLQRHPCHGTDHTRLVSTKIVRSEPKHAILSIYRPRFAFTFLVDVFDRLCSTFAMFIACIAWVMIQCMHLFSSGELRPTFVFYPRGSSNVQKQMTSWCRNGMLGASFRAKITALFFNVLLSILLAHENLHSLQNKILGFRRTCQLFFHNPA
jgi:hypothetical protein